jgi:small subunit ribosomal protein S1
LGTKTKGAKRLFAPHRFLLLSAQRGMEIDAVVLAIDAERERISLGIKQIEKDPFSAYQPSSMIS